MTYIKACLNDETRRMVTGEINPLLNSLWTSPVTAVVVMMTTQETMRNGIKTLMDRIGADRTTTPCEDVWFNKKFKENLY